MIPARPLLALLLAAGGALSAGEALVARVSQSVAPFIEAAKTPLAKSNPDLAISITGVPTPTSIKAVAGGDAQVGGIVRDLKAEEKTANPDLTLTPFARDGLALVVNAKNPVASLTRKQIADLMTGAAAGWKELGGADEPVTVIGRTAANAVNEQMCQVFGLESQATGEGKEQTMAFKAKGAGAFGAKIAVTGTHKDAQAQVVLKAGGFSFVPLGLALEGQKKGTVKILAIDGVAPTAATIADQTYPLGRTLSILTRGAPAGAAKVLVDWLLSAEGQAAVAERGSFPLK